LDKVETQCLSTVYTDGTSPRIVGLVELYRSGVALISTKSERFKYMGLRNCMLTRRTGQY